MEKNDYITGQEEVEKNAVQTSSIASQTSMKKFNGNRQIIIGGLLLLLFLVGGAYYLGVHNGTTNFQDKRSNLQPSTPSPTNTESSQTIDPTITQFDNTTDIANWKVYSSDVISFKYPNTLTLEERQKDYIVLLPDPNDSLDSFMGIDARLSSTLANFDNAVSNTKATLTNTHTEYLTNGVKISGLIGPGFNEGLAITVVLLKKGDSAISLETIKTDHAHLQLFDKIVSTITFTE